MKKLIALAVASVVATSANAWNTGVSASNNQAGELVFVAWNADTGKSFAQDLNVYTTDLLFGNKKEFSVTLSAEGLKYIGQGNIHYSIGGFNNDKTTKQFAKDKAGNWRANRGGVVTADKAPTPRAVNSSTTNSFLVAVENLEKSMKTGVKVDENVWTKEGPDNFGKKSWGETAVTLTTELQFSKASAAFSDVQSLYALQFLNKKAPGQYAGNGYISRLLGKVMVEGGVVKYAATPVNEVPVPAAAWLFGSALAGLAGLRRRK